MQIFRRADPAGRTIGEFVREDLSAKVGGADVFVGLPESGEGVDNLHVLYFSSHLLTSSINQLG